MQYVTEDVAREIERAVEVITSDEKGFLREAALQYIKENAPTDKAVGEKYIAIKPHGCDVPAGSILTLHRDDGSERPRYEAQDGILWWVYQERVRRISSLTAPEKPRPVPVKLYCVKPLADWLTVGNVYESVDGWMIVDDGVRCIDRTMRLEGYLYPLASRPAKVGEYILITSGAANVCDEYKIGDVLRAVKYSDAEYAADGTTERGRAYYRDEIRKYARPDEYLVIDGYDGQYEEREQPKPSAETALQDRIKHLEQENAMLEAENAKLCAKIAAIRKAVESEE